MRVARVLLVALAMSLAIGGAAAGGLLGNGADVVADKLGDRVPDLTPGPRAGDGGTESGRIGDRVVTVRDGEHPAIAGLDAALVTALRAATRDAAADDIRLQVTSGWRSRAYQQQLLDEAIENYGSRAEARRWVSTPDRSAHVTGEAVDVGPTDAAYWMQQYGAAYGLCQRYNNEIWHYELLTEPGGICPAPVVDGAS